MIKQKIYSSLILTLILTINYGQQTVNKFDENGKRHGLWTKNYHKTDQKRYEGVFFHGKEIDTFKYYTLKNGKNVLSAIKVFNKKDSIAEVTFYTSSKKVISKGYMKGRRYVNKWIFYHKNSNSKMIVEHYNDNGKLEGEQTIYYKNGLIAELTYYKNDKLHGECKWYSEKNKLLKVLNYNNGELNGQAIYYDALGNITSQGNYKDDQKKGIWFYYKNEELIKKIDHTNKKIIFKKFL